MGGKIKKMTLLAQIKKRAATWASQISRKANAVPKPSVIRVQSSVEEKSGKVSVKSVAFSVDPERPIARAYEYGSGIHSQSKQKSKKQIGSKGKILIAPKNAKVLAFEWQVLAAVPPGTWYGGAKLIKKNSEGQAIFRYVHHPGVQAVNGGKGYLRPAVKEVRPKLNADIGEIMGNSYRVTIKTAFRKR